MSRYTIAQANNQLSTIVHESEHGTTVRLTRRGKPMVIMLNIDEYTKLCATSNNWWENYLKWHKAADFSNVTNDDMDAVFANVRDRSPGRDLSFND